MSQDTHGIRYGFVILGCFALTIITATIVALVNGGFND